MNKESNKFVLSLIYLSVDIAAFYLAAFLCYVAPFVYQTGTWIDAYELSAFDQMNKFIILIPLFVFYGSGINKIAWSRTTVEDFHLIFRSLFFVDFLLYLAVYKFRNDKAGLVHVGNWPTSTFLLILPASCVILCAWRLVLRFFVENEIFSRARLHRIYLVGLSSISDEVVQKIMTNNNPSYKIIATFDTKGESLEGVTAYNSYDDLLRVLRKNTTDEVLFASAGMTSDDMFKAVQCCEANNLEYHILPSYIDLLASKSRVDLINFVPMISYSEPKIYGWNLFFKTVLDILMSLFILTLFSPFWVLICLSIVFDSRGSPIFSQLRMGRGGRLFRIYKFRTMVASSVKTEGSELTGEADVRITRVGAFLRRWSLDEVPQFLNVVFGQMSIMGPRAVVPFVADKFDDWEKISLNVLPGITGLAQVYGRNKLSFYEKSFLSVYYIRNYSLFLDLKILFRTFGTVLTGVGTGGTLESKRIVKTTKGGTPENVT